MTPPLDRAAFLRPIAHRGLHGASSGRVENTAPAFRAAVARGVGIECDLRPAASGVPMVFHDRTINRLVDGRGPLDRLDQAALRRLRYRDCDTTILSFRDMLDLVGGRVPILAEIKSEWRSPDADFLGAVARAAAGYDGPVALMSFDPDIMAALAELAPAIPRGIVARRFEGNAWWHMKLGKPRAHRLTHLLESRRAMPSFFAYDVRALPTPATRFVREVLDMPLFAWTVRTKLEWQIAADWADAPIFEERGRAKLSGAAGGRSIAGDDAGADHGRP